MRFLISAILILSASLIPLPTELAVSSYIIAFATLVGGAMGLLFLNSKHSVFLRLFVVYFFINTFLSKYPEWSIMGYLLMMLCLGWFLFLAKRPIEDLRPQKDVFVAILLINMLFVIVQLLDKDFALNLGRPDNMVFGSLGNSQILGSFLACIAGGVCLKKKWFVIPLLLLCAIVRTKGAFISIGAGVAFYLCFKVKDKRLLSVLVTVIALIIYIYCTWAANGLLHKNYWSGRLKCWPRTIELIKKRPMQGYGTSTFKLIYPANSGDLLNHDRPEWKIGDYKGNWVMYLRTHNDWLQILFEMGIIGFVLFVGFICTLIVRFIRTPKTDELLVLSAGLVSIGVNMIGAFPLRMNRLTPLIIFLLAMFYVLTKKGEKNEKAFDWSMFRRFGRFGISTH